MHFKFLPMVLIVLGLISGVPEKGFAWGEVLYGYVEPEEPTDAEIKQAEWEAEQEEKRQWKLEQDRRQQLKDQGEQQQKLIARQAEMEKKQQELDKKLNEINQQKEPPTPQQAAKDLKNLQEIAAPVFAAYKLEEGAKSGDEDSVLGPCSYVEDAAIGKGFSVPTGCDKSNFQVRSVTCKSLAGKVTFISTCKVDGAEISANRCADQHMAPLVKKDIDKKMNSSKKTKGAS